MKLSIPPPRKMIAAAAVTAAAATAGASVSAGAAPGCRGVFVRGVALRPAACAAARARRAITPVQQARLIGMQAYVYGLALLDEQRVIENFPANDLINVTELSTPAQRLVPAPNVDTLYTVARLLLRDGPLVLHVPDEGGRYYTMQFLDAYTNSFAYVGRRATGARAGDYAIVGPGWSGSLPAGVRRIQAPTPVVWLLGRTLVSGPGDLENAHAIQRQYTLGRLGGALLPSLFVPRSTLMPAALPQGLQFFDAVGAALAQSPPPASERQLMRRFASVGVGPGLQPSTEPLSAAVRAGLVAAAAAAPRSLDAYAARVKRASQRRHNGWLLPPLRIGNFASDYMLRAYIANTALGANIRAEAVYPFAFVDHAGHTLTGAHRYVLHFARGQLPPVNAFWSLTMYDKDVFLVPNPLGRYAVGDRTPGLRRNADGSLDIYIQRNPPKRSGQLSNWLPAPAGTFVLALRLYQPRPSVLRDTWPLPTVSRLR